MMVVHCIIQKRISLILEGDINTDAVSFEDALGRNYNDTIHVQFEIDDAVINDTFCAGSNYVWPIAESSFV
jgi:hypothetical protein